jgi:hypothetical protein
LRYLLRGIVGRRLAVLQQMPQFGLGEGEGEGEGDGDGIGQRLPVATG